jgi:hypothetical protein
MSRNLKEARLIRFFGYALDICMYQRCEPSLVLFTPRRDVDNCGANVLRYGRTCGTLDLAEQAIAAALALIRAGRVITRNSDTGEPMDGPAVDVASEPPPLPEAGRVTERCTRDTLTGQVCEVDGGWAHAMACPYCHGRCAIGLYSPARNQAPQDDAQVYAICERCGYAAALFRSLPLVWSVWPRQQGYEAGGGI